MRLFFLCISTVLTMFLFTACLPKQDDLGNFFQSNAATNIKNNYKISIKSLLRFKSKIDKRNPTSYDENLANNIYASINNLDTKTKLKFNNKPLNTYNEYLQLAFSKSKIENRNDYLVLGLYYLFYELYEIKDGHQLTSYAYDTSKIQRLYHNLQILKWKIKTSKDLEDNYLFLTWQNNWQIQLDKKLKAGEKLEDVIFNNLEYIKNKKESLLSSSNFSYEVLLTQMLTRTKNSLEILNVSPTEMSVDAIKVVFLFL